MDVHLAENLDEPFVAEAERFPTDDGLKQGEAHGGTTDEGCDCLGVELRGYRFGPVVRHRERILQKVLHYLATKIREGIEVSYQKPNEQAVVADPLDGVLKTRFDRGWLGSKPFTQFAEEVFDRRLKDCLLGFEVSIRSARTDGQACGPLDVIQRRRFIALFCEHGDR